MDADMAQPASQAEGQPEGLPSEQSAVQPAGEPAEQPAATPAAQSATPTSAEQTSAELRIVETWQDMDESWDVEGFEPELSAEGLLLKPEHEESKQCIEAYLYRLVHFRPGQVIIDWTVHDVEFKKGRISFGFALSEDLVDSNVVDVEV